MGFRRFRVERLSGLYRPVLARLQYGCSTLVRPFSPLPLACGGLPADEVRIVAEHRVHEVCHLGHGLLEALGHGGKARAVEKRPPVSLSGGGERVEDLGQWHEFRPSVGSRLFEGVAEPAGFSGVKLRERQDVGVVAFAGVGVAAGDHGLDLLGDYGLHRVAQQAERLIRDQGRVLYLLRVGQVSEI